MNKISEDQIRILEKQEIECKDIPQMMCDYADGDLTVSLRDRLDVHMSVCPNCLEFKESYLKTIQLAKILKPQPLNSEVQNRLRNALNERLGIQLSLV